MGEFTYLCVSILTNDWSYQEHFYCSNKHEKAIIFSKQLVDTFPNSSGEKGLPRKIFILHTRRRSDTAFRQCQQNLLLNVWSQPEGS